MFQKNTLAAVLGGVGRAGKLRGSETTWNYLKSLGQRREGSELRQMRWRGTYEQERVSRRKSTGRDESLEVGMGTQEVTEMVPRFPVQRPELSKMEKLDLHHGSETSHFDLARPQFLSL